MWIRNKTGGKLYIRDMRLASNSWIEVPEALEQTYEMRLAIAKGLVEVSLNDPTTLEDLNPSAPEESDVLSMEEASSLASVDMVVSSPEEIAAMLEEEVIEEGTWADVFPLLANPKALKQELIILKQEMSPIEYKVLVNDLYQQELKDQARDDVLHFLSAELEG